MAVPSNYIDKITKGNDSRMISPAADMVRVNNDNFEGTDLDGVLDEIAESISDAGGDAVSVIQPDPADGTFIIRVGSTDYTINLNHTHEDMAKLVVCEESDLPSTLEEDTIYGVEEDGEISVLYVGGVPFYGGGGGGTSTPILRQPTDESTIDVGRIASGESSVSKTITVKGKNLTQALTVAVTGTGYSANKQTISAADANVGTTLTITCTNTADDADGTLSLASSEVSCDCDLVANVLTYEELRGVKLTGSQWLQTGYLPNPNTEFELSCKFIENSLSRDASSPYNAAFIDCVSTGAERFTVYNGTHDASNTYGSFVILINNDTIKYNNEFQMLVFDASEISKAAFLTDMLIKYQKGSNRMDTSADTATFSAVERHLPLKGTTMSNALMIGRSRAGNIYNCFDLVIYELKIKENGSIVHDWVPKLKNGSTPGLYDTVTDTFISSETSTELVAVPLT